MVGKLHVSTIVMDHQIRHADYYDRDDDIMMGMIIMTGMNAVMSWSLVVAQIRFAACPN